MPVGIFNSTISCSGMLSRYFTSARKLFPCAVISTRRPLAHVRSDHFVPARQEAGHRILQALGQRKLVFGDILKKLANGRSPCPPTRILPNGASGPAERTRGRPQSSCVAPEISRFARP